MLISDIRGIKTYMDNKLVLSKDNFYNSIKHLRVIIDSLHTAGIKAKSPKCRFRLKYIPYLWYVLTQEVIKYDTKKVK